MQQDQYEERSAWSKSTKLYREGNLGGAGVTISIGSDGEFESTSDELLENRSEVGL